jgi:hypothetical protein
VDVAEQGRAARRRDRLVAAHHLVFSARRAEEIGPSQSREALCRLHDVEEAQLIIEKYDGRTTHLVEGTRLAKYLAANRIKLQPPGEAMAAYVKSEGGEGLKFKEELAKMLKQ